MDAYLDYLDELGEVIDKAGKSLLPGKISVEKEKLYAIIADMRLHVPDDIKRAQRIISENDKIIFDAQDKADDILRNAEADAKAKTNSHEIFRRASEQATEIVEDAKRDARELRLNAVDYADEMLERAEGQIKEYMVALDNQHRKVMDYYDKLIDVLYENRQQLRGK